jgi:hypothetical protein
MAASRLASSTAGSRSVFTLSARAALMTRSKLPVPAEKSAQMLSASASPSRELSVAASPIN